jgi:uncharacterized membrane protein YedE/YeeE
MFDLFRLDSPEKLILGLGTGLVFGFLLQRGGVTQYQVILGQFLWKNHTVLRTMLTAVVVGAAGIYGMLALPSVFGEVALHVKGTAVLANALGGVIFGVGMALLGYCPGTGVAAIGEGSRHAIFGVLGMLVGAAVYAELYPAISSTLLKVAEFGKIRFPDVTGISPWVFIGLLAVAAAILFAVLRKLERPPAAQA